MNKADAVKIVTDTFEHPFDENKYRRFIKELFNEIDDTKYFEYHGNYIPDAFKDHVRQYKRLGQYTDPDGNQLDVLTINLKKETGLERARTMQRNFAAWYLKNRGEKDTAVIAYYKDGFVDWRFSFVRIYYREDKKGGGKIGTKEELLPASRYSFLVGKNEPNHTAKQQLVPLLEETENNPAISQIEQAFNIESVTDEFFENYRSLFIWTKETLDKVILKDPKIKNDFQNKEINSVDFSKKLLGQIVFLYFLQKKGWFGVARDAKFGTGPKQFLRELFEEKYGEYKNFFNDILEPLFYEALRIDRRAADNFYSRFNCNIPFLNGGLFDPIGDYNWVHTDITLPNELFSNDKKTKQGDIGTGILDVFDRFNFTVNEDEPLEKEVAIDPELLGKAYEKFNAIRPDNFEEYKKVLKSGNKGEETKFNKQFGVYYTPREIVHFMCQQSLINYLATELESKVNIDDIEVLILHGEKIKEHDARVVAEGRETKDYPYLLPEAVRTNLKLIDEKLASIKVCDPAVGSGAFPVGMMSEIVKARDTLSIYSKRIRNKYDLKHKCIENSLYGVDIDPGAVEIAKLRLWLSLVVDEEDFNVIEPLPNLDYKIKQGDSLLSYYHGVSLEPHKRLAGGDYAIGRKQRIQDSIKVITDKKREYFVQSDPAKKKLIQKQIDNSLKSIVVKEIDIEIEILQKGIAQSNLFGLTKKQKDQFEDINSEINHLTEVVTKLIKMDGLPTNFPLIWEVDFGEVFEEKGGFDVVIANPPYVRQEKIKELKSKLELNFECFKSTSDLYTYFYERGIKLLTHKGTLTFISASKYFRSDYGRELRKYITKNCIIKEVIDFGELPVFEASTFPAIIQLVKEVSNQNSKILVCKINQLSVLEKLNEYINHEKFYVGQVSLEELGWVFENESIQRIRSKIKNQGKPLKSLLRKDILLGIKTGLNNAFIVDEAKHRQLIQSDKKSAEILVPYLKGDDIRKYQISFSGEYLILSKRGINIENYPSIYNHLMSFKNKLKKRTDIKDSGKWYELRSCSYYNEFEKEKIAFPEIGMEPRFALVPPGIYFRNSAHLIPTNDSFLLGLLNSRVAFFFFKLECDVFGEIGEGGRMMFRETYVERFPIPVIDNKQKDILTLLVDKILTAKKKNPQTDTTQLERDIDQLVYKLYGLTEEEIKIVERI